MPLGSRAAQILDVPGVCMHTARVRPFREEKNKAKKKENNERGDQVKKKEKGETVGKRG